MDGFISHMNKFYTHSHTHTATSTAYYNRYWTIFYTIVHCTSVVSLKSRHCMHCILIMANNKCVRMMHVSLVTFGRGEGERESLHVKKAICDTPCFNFSFFNFRQITHSEGTKGFFFGKKYTYNKYIAFDYFTTA